MGVDSPGGDSAYALNRTVAIDVEFSVPVSVAGEPVLALATEPPRNASYAGSSDARTLRFNYTVQQGDAAAGLDYAGVGALSLEGGATIRRAAQSGSAAALLTLPAPGGPGSLGHSRDIAVDGAAPSVASVKAAGRDGTYGTGRIVAITVAFDEPVVVKGKPALRLATEPPRSASYAGGSGTAGLEFWYAVQPGDSAAGLGYAGEDALVLGGGGGSGGGSAASIEDPAGNAAGLALPAPGSNDSLAASASIDVHWAEVPVIAPAGLLTSGNAAVLDNAAAVASFRAGNRTYAAAVSWETEGVQIVQVHENGTLSKAASATRSQAEFERLDGPVGVAALGVGNYTYIMAASGYPKNGAGNVVQLIRMHENGTLDAPGTPSWLAAADGHRLSGATGVDFFELSGSRTYAIVAAANPWASGLQLIRVHENGTLEAAGSLAHNANTPMRGARAVDAFEMAVNRTHAGMFAIVAASNDIHGTPSNPGNVQLVRIHENGTLEAADSLANSAPNTALGGAFDVDAFEMPGNRTYAIVASRNDDSLQLVRIHENGTLEAAGSLRDDLYLALDGARSVSAFAMGGRTYAIAAAQHDNGVQIVRVHENGTLAAVDTVADGPGFYRLGSAHGIDTIEVGGRTYAVVASAGSDDAVQLIRLSPASVSAVTTPLAAGTYPRGYRINVTVGFDAPVAVSGPPPLLSLALGDGRSAAAEYLSGSGTRDLVFGYTVQPGDSTGRLDYAGAGALAVRGAVTDVQGTGPSNIRLLYPSPPGDVVRPPLIDPGRGSTAADLGLPLPGMPGSLGHLRGIAIDSSADAYVVGVSSPGGDGAYGADRTVDIAVRFSVPVDVAGEPTLALAIEPPRNATYASGSGTDRLLFQYTVQQGDSATRLDYAGSQALSLDGGAASIRERSDGTHAVLGLPVPATNGSLGHSSNIVIETAPPSVLRVTSHDPDGTYGTGRILNITVAFDEPVAVVAPSGGGGGGGGGAPTLELSTEPPRNATYASGSGTDVLSFLYAVRQGDSADDLDYAGAGALRLNGAAISDLAGNLATNLTLSAPGRDGSLAASKDIAILGARLPVLAPGGSTATAGTLEFASAHRPAAFEAGNGTYAVVTSYDLGAALLLKVHENGTLESLDQIGDAGNRSLAGAIDVAAFEAGNGTYAVVGPRNEPGVQLLRVHHINGTLAAPYRLNDTADRALNGAIGVDAFEMGSRTYAIAASLYDHGVQLMEAHPGQRHARGRRQDRRLGRPEPQRRRRRCRL